MASSERSEIASWYAGRTIFVSGGSGLMGKVLLEKLLYSCTDLARIYVLVRSKRGRAPDQRIDDMLKLPLFSRLMKEKPHAAKKIVALNGDVVSENLGLSAKTITTLRDEVSVVFHFAATLKLEANLRDALVQNTGGTKKMIELCRGMKQLAAFVHLSTAFCYCDIDELGEKVYRVPDNPHDVISCAEWMRLDALEVATPKLIAPHPNTYTYSKRLAEGLIADEFPNMPMAIVRPSIVTPAWKEPIPGWVDNLNGPMGLLVGAGKGVIRSMHCNGQYHSNVIPLDFAINGLIAVGWQTGTRRSDELPVYNMAQDEQKKITWSEVLDKGRRLIKEYPFEMCVWYPGGDMRSSLLAHRICVFFFHLIPAYLIDFLMLIFRQKRFMVRIQRRISDGLELLQFFTTREWKFDTANFLGLERAMNATDRRIFAISTLDVDVDEYLKICMLGARQYCMKEDLKSLPRCRIQLKILYVLDKIVQFGFYFLLIWLVVSYSSTAKTGLDTISETLFGRNR